MKNKFSFKSLLIGLLLKDVKGTIIYCDNCGSPQTKYFDVNKQQSKDAIAVRYGIQCLKCGALGSVREAWERK